MRFKRMLIDIFCEGKNISEKNRNNVKKMVDSVDDLNLRRELRNVLNEHQKADKVYVKA